MAEYSISSKAEIDIAEILLYISDDDAVAAFAFERRLFGVFDLLADNPLAGRKRDELKEDTRSFAVGRYVIFYRIWAGDVAIVRVRHSAREIDRLLGE